MIEIRNTVTIARPGTFVSNYAADVRNEAEWWEGVTSVSILSGTPGAAGARYERTFLAMRKERKAAVTVEAHEPGKRLVVQSDPGPVTVRGEMSFSEVPEGTRVDFLLKAKTKWLLLPLARKIRKDMAVNTATSVAKLKAFLESKPLPTPAKASTQKTAQKKRSVGAGKGKK